MTASIQKDLQGPDWPLGFISVATPGTPVGIMSLVDPNNYNSPSTPSSVNSAEYTVRAHQIQFQGYKPGASHGMIYNQGFVYVVRKGVASGTGNRDDSGSIVAMIAPGQTYFLDAAPINDNTWSPYRYYIDADNATDGALVTLIIQ